MAQGSNFIRALVDNPATGIAVFRRLKRAYFIESELPLYDFVSDYITANGSIPAEDAFEAARISLPRRRRQSSPIFYAEEVQKRYVYDQMNNRFPALTSSMQNRNLTDIVDTLNSMIQVASSVNAGVSYSTLAEQLEEVGRDYEVAKRITGLRGVTLGWDTGDIATNGMMGGDIVVIAGRPSMGKSWVIIFMALQAWLSGKSIAFTSMEMSLLQIARRWLGLLTGINPNFIRAGELSTHAENRMYECIGGGADGRPAVHLLAGEMSKDVDGIESMIEQFNPQVVYVDAAYLLSPAGKRDGYISKWESIAKVVSQLKQLAIKYDIPIVISVQFNRNVKKSTKAGEVELGDIGGTDSIPQDASIVLATLAGVAPFQDIQRVIEMIKNREGELAKWATRFSFTPVNLSETELIDEEDEEAEVEGFNTSFMD